MQFDDKDIVKKTVPTKSGTGQKKIPAKHTIAHAEHAADAPLSAEKPKILPAEWLRLIDLLIFGGTIGLIFALPLFFLPLTTDTHELNKQVLLVFGTLALALLSSIRMLVVGRIEIKLSSVYAGIAFV